MEHLLKLCPEDQKFLDKVFQEYKHLKMDYEEHSKDLQEVFRDFANLFITYNLRFPELTEMVDKIDIKCDWYDISDELLFDSKDFEAVLKKYRLDVRKSFGGYETE
jgi:hypothetical protein